MLQRENLDSFVSDPSRCDMKGSAYVYICIHIFVKYDIEQSRNVLQCPSVSKCSVTP